MIAFEGTPGPWETIGHKVYGGGIHIASAWYPGNMPVVQDERASGESWIDCYTRLEPTREVIKAKMTANARLIAAAPELLEALDRLMSASFAPDPMKGECTPDEADQYADAWRNARAARLKATGGDA